MSTLCIDLLGQPHVAIDGRRVTISRRKSFALLAYLAVSGEAMQRDSLATLLWPETTQSKARGALRRELSSLRKTLEGAWLETAGDDVFLSPANHIQLDVAQFLVESGSQDLAAWLEAVDRYRGDFLSGFTLADSPEFDDWQFFEAEELRHRFAETLQRIIDANIVDPDASLPHARRLQTLDPLDEAAHRQLMRLYAQAGQQSAALRQYQLCEQILDEEMGVPPSDETVGLLERIRSGDIEPVEALPPVSAQHQTVQQHIDWGEAPDVPHLYGREYEVELLSRWLVTDRCRLVAVLGMGGMGKTALATHVAEQLRGDFDFVIWRSLRNAPPLDELLADLVSLASEQQQFELASDVEQQIGHLLALLNERRTLLVLDNAESILDAGHVGHFRDGYRAYGQLLRRIGEGRHRSCLILTSREKPAIVATLESETDPVRSLHLASLDASASQAMLASRRLTGSPEGWQTLCENYSGNPLALKLLTETVRELFDGDIDAFLEEETLIFGGVEALLSEQFERLSSLEQGIMTWLAIERRPVDARRLRERFIHTPSRRHLLEALRSLRRRSMLERTDAGFSQQNVVMEFISQRLIDVVCQEIVALSLNERSRLNRYALMLAQTDQYIRQSQRRIFLQPVADRLTADLGHEALALHLRSCLTQLREPTSYHPGYAAGNLLNLYLHFGFDVTDLDLSNLSIWQAYLQGVELQNVSLAHADLADSVFTDTIGMVMDVAISPDGTRLAVAESSQSVRIWRLSDQEPLVLCQGHTDWVNSVSFSPDGRTLASAGESGSVHLWDASTGEELALYEGHALEAWSACFNIDGRVIATCSSDHRIYLWDAQARNRAPIRPLADLHCEDVRLMAVIFSPNGRYLAGAADDGTIRIWAVGTLLRDASLRPSAIWQAHDQCIWALSFSPNGETLASGGADNAIHLWDFAAIDESSRSPFLTLTGHQGWVRSICFDPTGRVIASAGEDSTVRIWTPDDVKLKTRNRHHVVVQSQAILTGHTDKVTSVSFSPDGKILASGGDQSVRLWAIDSHTDASGATVSRGRFMRSIQGYRNPVYSIAFDEKGQRLASSHYDGAVRIWEREGDHLTYSDAPVTLYGGRRVAPAVSFSPNGQLVASANWDSCARLWDANDGRLRHTLRDHSAELWAVEFSPDSTMLASGGSDQLVYLWDTASGQLRQTLPGHSGVIVAFAFHPTSDLLASFDWRMEVCLWQPSDGQCLGRFPLAVGAGSIFSFTPDGCYLAVGSGNAIIEFYDVSNGRLCREVAGCGVPIVAGCLSKNGELLATATDDLAVHIWNLRMDTRLATLTGHTDLVREMAFSPDGRLLATGNQDDTIRLWDVSAAMGGSPNACTQILRVKRPYERTDITGVTGISAAQKSAFLSLGAIASDV